MVVSQRLTGQKEDDECYNRPPFLDLTSVQVFGHLGSLVERDTVGVGIRSGFVPYSRRRDDIILVRCAWIY